MGHPQPPTPIHCDNTTAVGIANETVKKHRSRPMEIRSHAAGHYFLGWLPQDNQPIRLNGAIYTMRTVLKFVASSAAEAELGALFLNIKEGRVLRLTLA